MIEYITEYFRVLFYALRGIPAEPITIIKEVAKVEYKDMSMTTHDIDQAIKAFPVAVWKHGITLEDFARSEGEQRVITWIRTHINIKSYSGPIRPA